jgi:hypothetical protein
MILRIDMAPSPLLQYKNTLYRNLWIPNVNPFRGQQFRPRPRAGADLDRLRSRLPRGAYGAAPVAAFDLQRTLRVVCLIVDVIPIRWS